MQARISVLVVDDHQLVRERTAQLIDADERLMLAGEATDGEEALQKIRELRPDAVVLDVFMPKVSGEEVLRVVRRESIEAKVLILTAGPTPDLHGALRQHPDSMLYKSAASEQICEEVVAMVSGEEHSLGQELLASAAALAFTRVQLSYRERLVLELAVEGLKVQETAEHLNISERVVEAHLHSTREKLAASTTTAAVAKAYDIGILVRRGLG